MSIRLAAALSALITSPLAAAVGAPTASTTGAWPCDVEPKASLKLADYWPAATNLASPDWRADPALSRLVADVAPRSVSVEDASTQLRQFVAHSSAPDPIRARLIAGLVETIDGERRLIITGIRRFNGRQEQLARRIEQGYVAVDATDAKPAAAESKATAEEQVQWDTRIFEDRQRMLPVVCRQPAALETRLAALVAAVKDTSSRP